MENRILITGATGNIGIEIIKLLKTTNANFVAGTTSGEAIEGVETVKADFADKESLRIAMQGITTLFMLLPSHPEVLKWGENVIDAAIDSGVNHIVRSSGSLADNNSPLKIQQLLGETDQDLIKSEIDSSKITSSATFQKDPWTPLSPRFSQRS